MTIINHAATGVLVAVAIHNPWIALPAAFLSHFVIDVIPHWDYKFKNKYYKQAALLCDITLTLWLLIILSLSADASRRLIIAGAFLGVLPDLMWAPYIMFGKPTPMDRPNLLHFLRRLHLKIQWSETPWGIYVEAVWFVFTLYLIYQVHR
jgi:Mn2+/Fe2+ NRAMP family transporter